MGIINLKAKLHCSKLHFNSLMVLFFFKLSSVALESFLIAAPVAVWSLFCYVLSSFAISSVKMRWLIALLKLYSFCLVVVIVLCGAVSAVCGYNISVHTHLPLGFVFLCTGDSYKISSFALFEINKNVTIIIQWFFFYILHGVLEIYF